MSRKRFASIALAVVLLVVAVVPALAVPPDRMEFRSNPTYEVADCGSFKVMNHEKSTIRLTFFYDTEGNLVRVNQFWSGTDTLTNSETGASISSDFHNHAVFDETTATVRQSGIFWHAIVPHHGPVFFQTGQVVAIGYDQPDPDVTFTGATILDETMLCSLLAG